MQATNDLSFFVGIKLEPQFEKNAKLFPLFNLEVVKKEENTYLGKSLKTPTTFQSLETFESHILSVFRRINIPDSSLFIIVL